MNRMNLGEMLLALAAVAFAIGKFSMPRVAAEGGGLDGHLGLGLSLPDGRTVVRFDAVSDDVGALAGGRWGIHAETADAPAVHCCVRGVGGGEWQMLEDRRVEHSQAVKPASWAALVVADGVHRGAHPLPP